ncbi:MAG TPA: hemerythrin domain-containing protein [Methanoregula sp.]|nr:hemerythrin domain-containing protein [Methanoregula sp.]
MVVPVDAVRAIHNAFRNDLERIDTAAFHTATGKDGLSATIERYRFFNEILVWHAHGEEQAIFPAVENVAPLVAEAYERDHRGLDAAFDELNISYSAHDALKTARATAAFRFHLDIHLDKEDAHLYRIFQERIPLPEQGKAIGVMASSIPRERYAEFVAWLYPLIGHDDRENMTRILQMVMPAPAFAGTKELIRKATGSDWAELTRRIPSLEPAQ